LRNPSVILTNLLTTAETNLAEYDTALRDDERKRGEVARQEAEALAEAKRLEEEEAAARAAKEAQERAMFAALAKQYGYAPLPESVIHTTVRTFILLTIQLTNNINSSPVPPVSLLGKLARAWKARHVIPVLASMGPVPSVVSRLPNIHISY
jgi:hypothetical protein